MQCSRCQHENEVGAKFCEECAVPLARPCGNCGHQLSHTAKFCPACAHPTGLAAADSTARRFTSPESYTPRYLAERILAEAGVGKSRLVYEFTHSHHLHGGLVLEGASVSYGTATSYLPVIDLLKGYFEVQDRDDWRDIRAKVAGTLLTLDRALEPTLPALLALLDVPVDDAARQTLDPGQRRQRTLDAVKRLLLREAHQQPLLVIFEDLHWIDGETQALLDGLVDSLVPARLGQQDVLQPDAA